MPKSSGQSDQSTPWARRRQVQEQIGCAILAAGLGRRLEPLTARYIPKPLFPLGGKVPIVQTWVRKLVASGITDLSMNLCVLKETIKSYFDGGSRFGANISYVEEASPSGTLGGVCKQVLGRDAKVHAGEQPVTGQPFGGSTVIAPSGDIVTNLGAAELEELYDIHRQAGAAFTMVLVPIPRERRKDFGTAELRGPVRRAGQLCQSSQIVQFYEKDPHSPSTLNNASIYLIEMRLLRELDRLRTEASLAAREPFYDFGKHVFPVLLGKLPYARLSADNLLWGVEYNGPWFDVGQKRDYLQVNERLLDGVLEVELPLRRQAWGYLGADAAFDPARVTIVPPVVIGNRCVVEPGAVLGPYAVIGDEWTIGTGARISRSILWERYPLIRESGTAVSPEEMRWLDPHEVRAGAIIAGSIVAGGSIDADIRDSTVTLLDDGGLCVTSIDYEPGAPRA